MSDMGNPRILLVGFGPYKPWASFDIANSEYGKFKDSINRVLKKEKYDVIATTDITVSGEGKSLVDARRWISRNSLRSTLHVGEKVKVVCAIDGITSPGDDISSEVAGWMEIMGLLFKEKHRPFVAAVLQDSDIPSKMEHLKKFFPGLDSTVVLNTVDTACAHDLKRIIDDVKPIEIKTRSCIVKKDIKAWSCEKVILFGRTGSGKSTIAQMLTRGHPSASGSFKASSNARGVTKDIEIGEGRGWHVTDTPGFGEAKEGSTVSTAEATKIIKKFVIDTCGIYSHFLYVVKKDRMNLYDERLWKFFNSVFAGAENNFSVVVTGCTLELNRSDKNFIEKNFVGCRNFIYVDFPSVSHDSELEEENDEVRRMSLLSLENGLANLGVADSVTSEGEYSTDNLRFVKSNKPNSADDSIWSAKLDDMIAHLYKYLVIRPIKGVAGHFHKSKIDENFILLPL